MSPKEWKFFEQVIELACRHAYEVGHAEGKVGSAPNPTQFTLKRGDKLTLQTELKKFVENR